MAHDFTCSCEAPGWVPEFASGEPAIDLFSPAAPVAADQSARRLSRHEHVAR